MRFPSSVAKICAVILETAIDASGNTKYKEREFRKVPASLWSHVYESMKGYLSGASVARN